MTPSLARTSAEPHRETLRFDGENRVYYVFVPSGLAAPAPALLLLHGSGRNGMSLINPWRGLAQKEGIILVAPDSSDSTKWDFRKDSLDFLHAVLEEIESKYAVEQRRRVSV